MTETALIGLWSADFRYGPGAMSDEMFAFLPDHRGFWETSYVGGSNVEAFRWALAGEGMLEIRGTASFVVEWISEPSSYRRSGDLITEGPPHLNFDGLPFGIAWEETPNGRTMEVLTLGESEGEWEMALRKTKCHLDRKYARTPRDMETYEVPAYL